MKRIESGRVLVPVSADDDADDDSQQGQSSTSAFSSLLRWAPVVVAAAGAGIAYRSMKKGNSEIIFIRSCCFEDCSDRIIHKFQ